MPPYTLAKYNKYPGNLNRHLALRAARIAWNSKAGQRARRYAAGKIGKAYKKYRGRPKPRMAQGPARRAPIAFDSVNNGPNLNGRQLTTIEVTNINQGTEPSERLRDVVAYSGFKVCMYVKNNAALEDLYFNIAVLRPKFRRVITTKNFFRSNAPASRGVDFDSSDLTFMDYHCRPINTDEMAVIAHQRYRITHTNADIAHQGVPSIRINKYFKFKKLLKYAKLDIDSEEVEKCTTPYYFCYWGDREGNGNNLPIQENIALLDYRIISYFRNPPG